MIRNTHSIRFEVPVSIVFVLLAGSVVQVDQREVGHPRLVEVFTTPESPVISEATLDTKPSYREIEFHGYKLDGIQRIEAKLSEGLPADPGNPNESFCNASSNCVRNIVRGCNAPRWAWRRRCSMVWIAIQPLSSMDRQSYMA